MAPEVVDQSGATTASDIWSLGCLVIELMEGKPPYSFLDPMPALFRIVNDDCPPIPEGASNVARDFLLQCFQKDVNLRISARKLLRHPWMAGAKRQLDQNKKEQASRNRPFGAHEETVQRVQEWNKATDSEFNRAQVSSRPPHNKIFTSLFSQFGESVAIGPAGTQLATGHPPIRRSGLCFRIPVASSRQRFLSCTSFKGPSLTTGDE